jgi:hypothetical protein
MILKDFKKILGIDDLAIREEECCCAKSAQHSMAAQNAISALIFGGEDGEKFFDCFNSVQGGHYEERMNKYRFVFIFMGEGEVARFYALYEVKGKITYAEADCRKLIPDGYKERIEGEEWVPNPAGAYFLLQKIPTPGNLERRLLVKFASGQQNAPTFLTASKYEVSQVEPIKIATEFTDYKNVYLTYGELKQVVKDKKWQDMLSRFGGVYLIHDINTGKNYIGSAYNKSGILGRWKNYAENPTGGTDEEGNAKLVELLRNNSEYAEKYFRYSILEVLPLSNRENNQDILDAEIRWKVHLGTRTHGLNAN